MPRRKCCRRQQNKPCTCEMGNLYRFVEPIVLICLARLGTAHGYQIAQEAQQLAVTHAGVDVGAVYRTLRKLDERGFVSSEWETENSGPSRRLYTLTDSGRSHLGQWSAVLQEFMESLAEVVTHCEKALGQ